MELHVRYVLEHSKRQGNPGLRGGPMELYLKGGLLGVRQKSHNVPHWLQMGRLMSI